MNTSIAVQDAKLSTAAVEIQTITVRGRKVTQALFRQFQDENIINDDYSLRGVPWGWVNYFWGGESLSGKPINLVWQLEDELRRCVIRRRQVPKPIDKNAPVRLSECVEKANELLRGEHVINSSRPYVSCSLKNVYVSKGVFHNREDWLRLISDGLYMKTDRFEQFLDKSAERWSSADDLVAKEEIVEHLQQLAEDCVTVWTKMARKSAEEARDKRNAEIKHIERLNQLHETLLSKPQLYIAM